MYEHTSIIHVDALLFCMTAECLLVGATYQINVAHRLDLFAARQKDNNLKILI